MTDPNAALVEAVERFLTQAKVAVHEELNRDGPLPLTPEMLAESVTGLPAAREAQAAAHQAATANNYLVTSWPRRRSRESPDTTKATADTGTTNSQPDDETAEPNGRPLDADFLISTGVFGLLRSRAPSAVATASCVAKPPRRTRRRSPDAAGRSALKYHDPCPGELSPGQPAPSSLPDP